MVMVEGDECALLVSVMSLSRSGSLWHAGQHPAPCRTPHNKKQQRCLGRWRNRPSIFLRLIAGGPWEEPPRRQRHYGEALRI